LFTGLAFCGRLRFPTVLSNRSGSTEGFSTGSISDIDRTQLASSDLVFASSGSIHSGAKGDGTVVHFVDGAGTGTGASLDDFTSTFEQISGDSDEIQAYQQSLQNSSKISFARQHTNRTTVVANDMYMGVVNNKEIRARSVVGLANYLVFLFASGLGASSLGVHRAAICSRFMWNETQAREFENSKILTRIVKGAFHTRPRQTSGNFWDGNLVLILFS
jgi:hypothetical protein